MTKKLAGNLFVQKLLLFSTANLGSLSQETWDVAPTRLGAFLRIYFRLDHRKWKGF